MSGNSHADHLGQHRGPPPLSSPDTVVSPRRCHVEWKQLVGSQAAGLPRKSYLFSVFRGLTPRFSTVFQRHTGRSTASTEPHDQSDTEESSRTAAGGGGGEGDRRTGPRTRPESRRKGPNDRNRRLVYLSFIRGGFRLLAIHVGLKRLH